MGTGGEIRKTVTVLFCDVTGSTSLGEQLDPESLRAVMSRFFEEMRSVLERHGGTVEKFIGDAVMAVFGIPVVHEDDPLRAVRAAVEMRESLATLNKELERDRGVTIASRIGVNTGAVVAGDATARQSFATGDAVNVAARLEQAAEPGEILIGASTMDLVRDAVVATPVEPLMLKGKTARAEAFRLEQVGEVALGVARRLDAPMVGRASELKALRACFDRAARERTCVLATILGAPGVGKSRLVREFLADLPEPAVVVRGRCLSYGDGITYWPVVEMLTAIADIQDTDGPAEVRAKVDGLLDGMPDGSIAAERLAEFLGLAGAAASPEETNWAIRKLFEALATERPLVAVVEDIHWAEPGLLDLIEHVLEWTVDAAILLVCPARADLLDTRPSWGGGTTSTTLRLEPLSSDESDLLIEGLLGGPRTPAQLTARVMDAAEGNPLFVEQMVAMLIDEGHLRRNGEGWVVTGDLSDLTVPATIAGLLQARLDRLPDGEQRVIERGAVEGRVFHWGSVTELSTDLDPGEVGRHLMSLRRRDLIGPERGSFGGSEAFRFRHALIRDAAYERIPKHIRAELHEGHARWLERTAGDRVAEFEDVLAYHLDRAVQLRTELGPLDSMGRALAAEAAARLTSAGVRATERGDFRAAGSLLRRAVERYDPDDEGRVDVLVRLAEVLTEAGDMESAAAMFSEALEAARATGDARVEIRAGVGAAILRLANDPEGATAEIDRIVVDGIPLLEEAGDDEGLARAWKGVAEIQLMHARSQQMVDAYERAAFHAERAGDRRSLADALGWLALAAFWDRSTPEEGIQRARELRARLPDNPYVRSMTMLAEGQLEAMRGRFDDGRALYREGREILVQLGAAIKAAGTRSFGGRIEHLAGDLPAAERELRRCVDELSALGELGFLSSHAVVLGQILYEQDRVDEADEMSKLSETAAASDDLISQAQWRGLRAKVLARRDADREARALLDEALAILEGSDMLDLQWERLEDLAEVHRLAGRPEEAAQALRELLALLEVKGVTPLIERVRAQLQTLEASIG